MPRTQTRSKATPIDRPSATELRAATTTVIGSKSKDNIQYLYGCNISWMPSSPASPSISFGVYIEHYPAELARIFSDECYQQLPRRPVLTAKKTRPAVELSRTKTELVLRQVMWHPADALEWLFEWYLRFAEDDRSVPRAPEGVYNRFHWVELVNWLKLLDVAVFVGAHGWFVRALRGKIEDWDGPAAGGWVAEKKIKDTIQELVEDARGDLIETVASGLACGWQKQVPNVFGVDAKLYDEVKAAVAKQQTGLVVRPTLVGQKSTIVLVSSLDVEEDMASQSSSTIRGDVESSRTGSLSSDGDQEMESEPDSLVEDSMLEREELMVTY